MEMVGGGSEDSDKCLLSLSWHQRQRPNCRGGGVRASHSAGIEADLGLLRGGALREGAWGPEVGVEVES